MGRTVIFSFENNIPPPLTKAEIKELEEAAKRPIVYDEDCPPLTDEQLSKMYRASDRKRKLQVT